MKKRWISILLAACLAFQPAAVTAGEISETDASGVTAGEISETDAAAEDTAVSGSSANENDSTAGDALVADDSASEDGASAGDTVSETPVTEDAAGSAAQGLIETETEEETGTEDGIASTSFYLPDLSKVPEQPSVFSRLLGANSRSLNSLGVYEETYRSELPAESQGIYDALQKYFIPDDASFSTSTIGTGDCVYTLSAKVTRSEFYKDTYAAYFALLYDYPEVFWIRGAVVTGYSYGTDDSFFKGKLTAGNYDSSNNFTAFVLDQSNTSDINSYCTQVSSAVTSIKSSRKSDSRYDTAVAIHDYVAGVLTYPSDTTPDRYHSSLPVFIAPNDGVCEAYSRGCKVLCKRFGIPCALVISSAHMWDYIQMENQKWYMMDITWDDTRLGGNPVDDSYILVGSGTVIDAGTSSEKTASSGHSELTTFYNMTDSTMVFSYTYPELSTTSYKEDSGCVHVWDEGTTTAACTEAGVRTQVCTKCGSIRNTDEAALGHDFQLTENVAATCTEDGYDLYTCSRCGVTEKRNVTAALGHDFQLTEHVAATCTEGGYDLYTCSRCGVTEKRNAAAALGHDYQLTKHVAVTCTEDGYDLYTCSRCGAARTDTVTAPGHDYQLTRHVAAACTEDGYDLYTCSRCGVTEKRNAAAAPGHSYTVRVVEPTTVSDGYTVHTCLRCGLAYADTPVEKLLQKTVFLKLRAVNSKKYLYIKWEKIKQYKWYQIQYALTPDFSGAVTRRVSGKKATVIKKIRVSRNKTYFVRIRAVDGTRVGAWSKVRKISTK